MAGHIVIAVLLGVLAALSPSASAQEIRFGFDATVDVEGRREQLPGIHHRRLGARRGSVSRLGLSTGTRVRPEVELRVPSLQLGVAVRRSMRTVARVPGTGVPEEHNTEVGAGVTLARGGQIDYGTKDDDHRINDGGLRQALPADAHAPGVERQNSGGPRRCPAKVGTRWAHRLSANGSPPDGAGLR